MELDTDQIDDAVLALLYLGLHDGVRAWKGFDWAATDRLHEKGYISDPRGKTQIGCLHRTRAGAGEATAGTAVWQAHLVVAQEGLQASAGIPAEAQARAIPG